MKKLLLLSAALLLAASPALADSISVLVQENGSTVGSASSADGTLNIEGQSYGTFNLNTLTINDASFLAPPGILSTNTLNVAQAVQTMTNVLDITITAMGLTGTGALTSLLSEFSVTGLTSGWTVQELTSINGSPLSSTPVITANSASADLIANALLTNPYDATVEYIITANSGSVGEFNGGIDISVAPTPIPGAVWMFGSVLGLGGMLMRRKKQVSSRSAFLSA
jgi:hypothetical protein